MTLVAFATYGKRAEFITDSAAYSPALDRMDQCTKHLTLNHLDAALLAHGPLEFSCLFWIRALAASVTVANFDELVDGTPSLLLELREDWRRDSPDGGRSGVFYRPHVVLIGWSDRAQEFVGYVFASEQDFAPTVHEGLWAYPMPWTSRPTDLELGNLPAHPRVDEARELWTSNPPRPTPKRQDDWRSLAIDVRTQRGSGWANVAVGGNVTHTRLERGSVITKRIHRYDDTGEEFAAMVAGTAHPVALARACDCGSGLPFGECHVTDLTAQPCYCESGRLLGECCWRADDQAVQPQAVPSDQFA